MNCSKAKNRAGSVLRKLTDPQKGSNRRVQSRVCREATINDVQQSVPLGQGRRQESAGKGRNKTQENVEPVCR